jgi:hypothetical protein
MNENLNLFGSMLVAFIVGFVMSIWLLVTPFQQKTKDLRKQAIERGHAEYVVDSDGKTTWQWKDKQND